MIKKHLFGLSLFLLIPLAMPAQSECACCTEKHAEFNFWIGDWMVYDTIGNLIGENHIEHLEDRCILYENWKGSGGGTGRSFNFYDASDSTWNQLWLDNKGSNLMLKGRAEKNKMILTGVKLQEGKNGLYRNRITWTLNEDKTVSQQWDIIDKQGEFLFVAFKGIYKKK